MKKATIFLMTLLICLTVGCSKQHDPQAEDTLCIVAPAGTKVHLDGLKTCWDKGDELSVFYKSETLEKWTFNGNTGDVSGHIAHPSVLRESTRDDLFVLYPYDASAALNGNQIITTIPHSQEFKKGSYGTALMATHSTFEQLTLYYCTSIVELKLTGQAEIAHITLIGNNSEKLCGSSVISFNGEKPELVCNGSQSVTLECNTTVASEGTTSFYFSVAPCVLEKGFNCTVYFKDGGSRLIRMTEKVSLKAGHVFTLAAFSNAAHQHTKTLNLTFSDGTMGKNPFTSDFSCRYGQEVGPYYYKDGNDLYPFYFFCAKEVEAGNNFRTTNGGLYIGGNEGDYITLPGINGWRLVKVAVSVHKVSDFHISPADDPGIILPDGVCRGTVKGDFRLFELSETEIGAAYRIYLDNEMSCFRTIMLYYTE